MIGLLFLYLSFLQLGLFGVGGDASAQAILEHEVCTLHHWLTPEQMADLMAFCQILPGGYGMNAATLSGQMAAMGRVGFWGSAGFSGMAVLALCTASVFWTWLINRFTSHAPSQTIVDCVLVLLRPLIPGLIASAAILLINDSTFGSLSSSPWHFWVSVFLLVSTLLGISVYRFNAMFMVLLCGVAGMILL